MSEDLPTGWVQTMLGDVCLPVASIQPDNSPDAEFTYFDIGGIDNESNRVAETKTFTGRNAPSRARRVVQKDDILFSTVRTYLRKIAIVEKNYQNPLASTGFTVLRAARGVSPRFLFLQMLSESFLEPLHKLQTGTSYPAVRDRDVLSQQIVLPPTQEQERIVAKLDAALLRLERAERATHRAKERVDRYRSAVLDSAMTGKLTRLWREAQWKNKRVTPETGQELLHRLLAARRHYWEEAELARLRRNGKSPQGEFWKSLHSEPAEPNSSELPEVPEQWAWASLDMIAEIGTGISVSQNRTVKNPVELPYLRVANVLRGRLDLTEIKTIRVEKQRAAEYLLEPGDILFNEGGDRDKLGRGWVWEGQIPKCVHQNHVFRARLFNKSLMDARFVSHWGNTYGQKFFLRHATQTTNLASINRTVLGRLPVPIPPPVEQSEIIREAERRLMAAERLATTLDRLVARAETTRQSLLREAFAGRLVPQEPNDEPASVLLQRLRITRGAEGGRLIGGRMSKLKSTEKAKIRRPLLTVLKENGGSMTPEELFIASGHAQESVDLFFAELRQLTGSPVKVQEERGATGLTLLKVVP